MPSSPNTEENANVVPTLKNYGVNPKEKHVHGNLLYNLYIFNKKHVKSSTLHCIIQHNLISTHVHIPFSKDFVRMKQNAQKTKCISDVLMSLGDPAGNNQESFLDSLTYIATCKEAVRAKELILPIFYGAATKALQFM